MLIAKTSLLLAHALFSAVSQASTLMQLPIFLQEIVLALWLIARGFNPKAVAQ